MSGLYSDSAQLTGGNVDTSERGTFKLFESAPAPERAAPVESKSAASVLYGSNPAPVADKTASAEVQAARAADVGRSLYSTDKLFEGTGLDAIDGLDHVAATELMRDMGCDPSDARQLAADVASLPNITAANLESWMAETARIPAEDRAMARAYLALHPRSLDFYKRFPDLAVSPDHVRRVISLARADGIKKGSR